MARERSPARNEARRVWLDSGGTMTARQVAEIVGTSPAQIRKWKSADGWQAALEAKKPPRKRGGQPGNKNAAGAGAPAGNRNAETHGAYNTVRLEDLPPEQREYIQSLTLDTARNMLSELQLLLPKGQGQLNKQLEKLAKLQAEEEALCWDIDNEGGKPPSKQQEKQLERIQREIAALQDTTSDKAMELEESPYITATQTVVQTSAFDRVMKLEAELNKTHGRIIKLLDSIKGYELECRRVRLEERKYNLAKQKLSGAFEVNPETGEIDDEKDDISDGPDV